jgi:hypothetical protein
VAEQVYRYQEPSRLALSGDEADLVLATSGGRDRSGSVQHPRFFDGFLGHAEQMATALLVVARVSRTRFYVPPGMLAAVLRAADPVVTSNGDRLRFESFSACAGVYARLDALPGSLDGPALSTGTTNVDVNPPLREALARVGSRQSMHLAVGRDVTLTTAKATVTEEKVPLPDRWLRGFAEVQVAGAGMTPLLEVGATEARRFLRSLPRSSGARSAPLWAVPAGRGLRLTGAPGRDAVCLSGPERLRVLEPLLRFAGSLRGYAPAESEPGRPAASMWELSLDDARMVITLSPEISRGFSGEGGVLRDLADPQSAADADLVAAMLAYEPRVDVLALAAATELAPERVLRALGRLGAAGRVGYDTAECAYFHRELPYDAELLEAMHPRLVDARALVASGAVVPEGDGFQVRSRDVNYVVRQTPTGYRCTCPWYGKHRDDRGPCKHVLAVEQVARS